MHKPIALGVRFSDEHIYCLGYSYFLFPRDDHKEKDCGVSEKLCECAKASSVAFLV